jgi:photosystem II stability/assembly factor-like uncharacterized protein
MGERSRVLGVTGEDVVRFGLEGSSASDPELMLRGVGAQCLAVDPRDPDRVYVGTFDRGLYRSQDGGLTWRDDGAGLGDRRVMSVAVSPSHQEAGISAVYAGTEPSNLYRSADGGRRWERLPALRELPSEPHWSFPPRPWTHHVRTIALHPTDPDWLAAGIELGGVVRSRDGGATWIDHNPQAHSDAHELLMHPLAPERLYEAAGQGIARSENLGDSWSKRDEGLDRHYAWAQAIDPADPNLWYVAVSRSAYAAHGGGDGQAHLWRSRGNGWTAVDNWGAAAELRRMPYTLTALPGRPNALLVGLRGGMLLLTDDTGDNWTRVAVALEDIVSLHASPA